MSPQRLLALSPLLCSCRAPLVHIGLLPEEPGAPRTRNVPQRSPQPPPLRDTAWAAHTLDRNSPAAVAGLQPQVASANSHSPLRSIPRPGRRRPLNAHGRRRRRRRGELELTDPIPPGPRTPGQTAAAAPVATASTSLAAAAPPPPSPLPPVPAPPTWGSAHWPSRPGAGLGALQQKGWLLALVRGALVVSCTLVRRPQRCRTDLPPRAACRRTGGANLRNKSPFAFQQ